MGALLYISVKDMLKYRYYLEDIGKNITFTTKKQKNILLTIKNIYIMKTKGKFHITYLKKIEDKDAE